MGDNIYGEATGGHSGESVLLSADGSRVAIGAPENNGANGKAGHVRVYEYNSGTDMWVKLGNDIDGEAANDRSGTSVSISSNGSRVAIGAHRNDDNGDNAGHIRVYEYNSGTMMWNKLGNDIDGENGGDQSGESVSLSADGSRVAIGAPENGNAGHVRIYEYNSGNMMWDILGNDIDGEASSDESGGCVSLSSNGNRVAIGAVRNDGNLANSGHVRVYEYKSGAWVILGQDIDGEARNDQSARSVSLSSDGRRVAIGAIRNSNDRGHIRVFKLISPIPSLSQWALLILELIMMILGVMYLLHQRYLITSI